MRLSNDQCWNALRSADHGVLCTASERGTLDAVPICFAVVSSTVVTPVDRVKPKSTADLGRLKNLAHDPAATLLCEQWSRDDWSKLWWVRARLMCRSAHEVGPQLRGQGEEALRDKYPQYRGTEFAELVVLDVRDLVGWAAADAQAEEMEPLI
jgi:PPOX class probable F420-dependent enzyme